MIKCYEMSFTIVFDFFFLIQNKLEKLTRHYRKKALIPNALYQEWVGTRSMESHMS